MISLFAYLWVCGLEGWVLVILACRFWNALKHNAATTDENIMPFHIHVYAYIVCDAIECKWPKCDWGHAKHLLRSHRAATALPAHGICCHVNYKAQLTFCHCSKKGISIPLSRLKTLN